ncbi:MAG: PKD domain-containing protein [Bacteroidales bacterium]|nr:PKD domain-containing protein [Bacteroidales bacterium]
MKKLKKYFSKSSHIFYILILIISISVISSLSCKKIADDIIDCSIEAIMLSVHYETDTINSKIIHFEFKDESTGDFKLRNEISWNFGDGQSIKSTGLKIDHTYQSAGTFEVVASYILEKGSNTCNGDKKKTVKIE